MDTDCKDGILDRTSPAFPGYARPTAAECDALHAVLSKLYGERVQVPYQAGEHPDLLDSMVKTILSQNTTDLNSSAAFLKLKARFPAWEEVRTSPVVELEETIRSAGLAQTKSKRALTMYSRRIKAILDTLHEEKGGCTMEYLRDMSNDAIKKELARFNGVGPKTISCMLLFNMQRPDMAVDTHIFRLAQRAGWVPTETEVKRFNKASGIPSPAKRRGKRKSDGSTPTSPAEPSLQWQKLSRESVYEHLNACVPDGLKYGLHLLIIAHGKATCRSRGCDGSSLSPCPVCVMGGKTYPTKQRSASLPTDNGRLEALPATAASVADRLSKTALPSIKSERQ